MQRAGDIEDRHQAEEAGFPAAEELRRPAAERGNCKRHRVLLLGMPRKPVAREA